MLVFFTILAKVVPLYFSVLLGFFSTYFLKCDKESIAKILLFILSPLVVFNATLNVKLDSSVIFLPTFFFVFSSILSFTLLYLFKKIYTDNTANLLAFSTSTGNTGNIGIPLAIIFLEAPLVDIFIFTILASILYQNSIGYYITAKGDFSVKDSLKKVFKLPIIYAFILGLIFNLLEIKIPLSFEAYSQYLKGTYSILGMMLVGMGIEKFHSNQSFDIKFISFALFIKFVIWPFFILLFIFLDSNFIHYLNKDFYLLMFLFSIVPLAGNTITVATILNVKPEKMSLTVLVSVFVSIFYIPIMMFFYMN